MTLTALPSVVVIRASISIVALTCHERDEKKHFIGTALATVVAHTAYCRLKRYCMNVALY